MKSEAGTDNTMEASHDGIMVRGKRAFLWTMAAIVPLLSGCGGGGGDAFNGGTTDPISNVAEITLIADSPQMGTAATESVGLTAIAKDSNNAVVSGETVSFTATSGSLTVTQSTTDDSGTALATISPGTNATNRTITVTATSGDVSSSYSVTADGSSVTVAGPTSVVFGNSAVLTINVKNSSGTGVSGETVSVSTARGNTLSASTLATNSSGVVSVTVTGAVAGTDTITVSALGASTTHSLNVSSDQFTLSGTSSMEIAPECHAVNATWSSGGSAKVGSDVTFSATRGSLFTDVACGTPSATGTVATDGSGVATIYIMSANSGPTEIVASGAGGDPAASMAGEFYATTPDSLILQASESTIDVGDSVTLTATVRDASLNLVKGAKVNFTFSDQIGGSLSPQSATTDSLGKASTVYTAASVPSSEDGVSITATVDGYPAITQTATLTVGGGALYVRVGLANYLEAIENETMYRQYGVVLVSDANGHPVANAPVSFKVIPTYYDKGTRDATLAAISSVDGVLSTFQLFSTNRALSCPTEDDDSDGNLDGGEDDNGDGQLTPGIGVVVAPAPGTTAVTNSSGAATFVVDYIKDWANWVQLRVTATAEVQFTESSDSVEWVPPMSEDDADSPPGVTSPFGTGNACANPN